MAPLFLVILFYNKSVKAEKIITIYSRSLEKLSRFTCLTVSLLITKRLDYVLTKLKPAAMDY